MHIIQIQLGQPMSRQGISSTHVISPLKQILLRFCKDGWMLDKNYSFHSKAIDKYRRHMKCSAMSRYVNVSLDIIWGNFLATVYL